MGFFSKIADEFQRVVRRVEKEVRRGVDRTEEEGKRVERRVRDNPLNLVLAPLTLGATLTSDGAEFGNKLTGKAGKEAARIRESVSDELTRTGKRIEADFKRNPEIYLGAIALPLSIGVSLVLTPVLGATVGTLATGTVVGAGVGAGSAEARDADVKEGALKGAATGFVVSGLSVLSRAAFVDTNTAEPLDSVAGVVGEEIKAESTSSVIQDIATTDPAFVGPVQQPDIGVLPGITTTPTPQGLLSNPVTGDTGVVSGQANEASLKSIFSTVGKKEAEKGFIDELVGFGVKETIKSIAGITKDRMVKAGTDDPISDQEFLEYEGQLRQLQSEIRQAENASRPEIIEVNIPGIGGRQPSPNDNLVFRAEPPVKQKSFATPLLLSGGLLFLFAKPLKLDKILKKGK